MSDFEIERVSYDDDDLAREMMQVVPIDGQWAANVSARHLAVVLLLKRRPCTVGDIGRLLDISQAAASELSASVVRHGLAYRAPDDDKRKNTIAISGKGVTLVRNTRRTRNARTT